MAITSDCGPHCGIRANAEDTVSREGHCPCGDPCHAGGLVPPSFASVRSNGDASAPPLSPDGQPLTGKPMCSLWYERAGDHRPWLPQDPPSPWTATGSL